MEINNCNGNPSECADCILELSCHKDEYEGCLHELYVDEYE